RPEHGVAVRRFAEAPLLGSANRDIESDGIARDVAEGVLARHVVRLPADDNRQLDLVVVAAIELAQGNTFAGTDERADRLEKEPRSVNRRGVAHVAVMQ